VRGPSRSTRVAPARLSLEQRCVVPVPVQSPPDAGRPESPASMVASSFGLPCLTRRPLVSSYSTSMTIKRMDNVGIVVEDLDGAIAFFGELGLELEGRAPIEGAWAEGVTGLRDMRVEIAM